MGSRGRLQGKVCIVTGAGSRSDGIGNGRATAMTFTREGARVVAVDRDEKAAHATAARIKDEGGECRAYVADVTKPTDCADIVAFAVDTWGRMDNLHNNVGIEGPGTVVDADEEHWDQIMAVNVKSMMLMAKHAVPVMVANGGGSILNVASIAATRPHGLTPYSTSKGAVIALTRSMAVDHGPAGIRVNCIAPGPIYTPMVAAGGMTDDLRRRRKESSVLRIEGTPWDVANAALFLASDEARYVTGVVLPVDGGVSVRSPDR